MGRFFAWRESISACKIFSAEMIRNANPSVCTFYFVNDTTLEMFYCRATPTFYALTSLALNIISFEAEV